MEFQKAVRVKTQPVSQDVAIGRGDCSNGPAAPGRTCRSGAVDRRASWRLRSPKTARGARKSMPERAGAAKIAPDSSKLPTAST
jgi:hypothetical protein